MTKTQDRMLKDAISDFEMAVVSYMEDTRTEYLLTDARKHLYNLVEALMKGSYR